MNVLSTYKSRLSKSYNIASGHWDRAIDNYKHYLGRIDTGGMTARKYPFSSKMTTSISYDIVETVMPRIIGRDPEFTAVATEESDIPYEQTAKMVIETEYNNPKLVLLGEPIYKKLYSMIKETLIIGNGVLRAYWRRETTKRLQYQAMIKSIGKIGNIADIVEFARKHNIPESDIQYIGKMVDSPFLDDFDVRHVPFFFFFPDHAISETGRMRYKIEREYMTYANLADEAKFFGYDKKVMDEIYNEYSKVHYGFNPSISKDFLYDYNELFSNSVDSTIFQDDSDKIPLLIVDKMWEGNKVHVIVNEKWVLTGDGMPNPYKVVKDPFIFAYDVIMPHSYFARGEPDAVKRLEDGINDLINMRMENLIQSMLNIWIVNPFILDDYDSFSPVPNSIYTAKDVDKAIRPIRGNDVTANAYEETKELYQYAQRIAGINDYVRGAEGVTLAGRTYGGLRLAQEAANARFVIKSRVIEEITLKSLGYFMLEFSRQFMTKDRIVRLVGKSALESERKFSKIKMSELKAIKGFMDIKVIPNSSHVIDEQAEAMKMDKLAEKISTAKPPFDEITPNLKDRFLLKYLPLYGFKDAMFWIREIRKSRQQKNKEEKLHEQQQEQQPPVEANSIPTQNIMTSGGVVNQPNPLSMILAGQNGLPIK